MLLHVCVGACPLLFACSRATYWWCSSCWCPGGLWRRWWCQQQRSLSDSHSRLFWSHWLDTVWGHLAWETHTHDPLVHFYTFIYRQWMLPRVTWVFVMKQTGSGFSVSCLPEAKDLRKILPFSHLQGDVFLWTLCLHSCTVDLRRKRPEDE